MFLVIIFIIIIVLITYCFCLMFPFLSIIYVHIKCDIFLPFFFDKYILIFIFSTYTDSNILAKKLNAIICIPFMFATSFIDSVTFMLPLNIGLTIGVRM